MRVGTVFKDWLDGHSQCHLHHAVGDGGYPQGALLIRYRSPLAGLPSGNSMSATLPFRAARFGDPDPFDGLELVGVFVDVLLHGEQPSLAVFFKTSYRDAVHAAGPCVGQHFFPSQLKGSFCADFIYQDSTTCFLATLFGGPLCIGFLAVAPQVLFRLFIPHRF